MKKYVFLIFIFLSILLNACSANQEDVGYQETLNNEVELLDTTIPLRKIIYEVEMSMNVRNLENAIDDLRLLIESDEWFDYESISTHSASFIVRIKTERLDDFIDSVKGNQTLNRFSKIGTDVSLSYQDASNKILNYEAQYARLLDLYETANLSEMITINQQLSQLEVNIAREQGNINQFDSLADYSEVRITYYASAVTSKSPFINRIGSAFVSGFDGLISFFDGLLIVIATIIPFAVVFIPTGYGMYRLYKHMNQKHVHKKTKDHTSNSSSELK